MNRRPCHFALPLLFLLLTFDVQVRGETETTDKPRRARLPQWKTFPNDIFFEDAFRDALVGTRPTLLGRPPAVLVKSPSPDANPTSNAIFHWSTIVSDQTLEDEVKSLQIAIDAKVTTPGRFSSGAFKELRRDFSELAMLFAVIGEYDKRVRWKDDAPVARDLFARAAANAKVSSIQAFNEAKQRKFDLQNMVRGGTLDATSTAERKASWEHVCDRGPIMKTLTIRYEEGIALWTANATEFKKNQAGIRREAEMLRLVAEVLTREGMEDADDEDYAAHCRELDKAAASVLEALDNDDPQGARQAAAAISKSCDRCHEDYR